MARKSKHRGTHPTVPDPGDTARRTDAGRASDRPRQPDRMRQAARVGVAAALIGALAFLIGPISWQNARDWAKTIFIAGGLALVIRWGIAEPYKIPSGSMEPTLQGDPGFGRGDRVFVNKWKYGLRYPFLNKRIYRGAAPKRFDIVVFKSVEENPLHATLVKRIVGMPGDRVLIRDGKVRVNGLPLEMPPELQHVNYTDNQTGMRYGVIDSERYTLVPDDHYLLLGDNSASSRDGRFFGWVPNEHLLGPVACIWWPPSSWRDFTGFTRTWWWRGLLVAAAAYIVWRALLGRSVRIVDDASDSALRRGDHVYVDRVAFGVPAPFGRARFTSGRAPRRGELIVYRHPDPAMDGHLLLGRVVGLPGEEISFDADSPRINGNPIDGSALGGRRYPAVEGAPPYGRSVSKEFRSVPQNSYFVLSEDAEVEADSRVVGWVSRDLLVGVVTRIWWPLSRAGRIKA